VITLAALVARARETLLAAGVPADEAAGDAEVLARHALDWDLTRYALGRSRTPPNGFADRYDPLIARRARREPVSQIVGHREFWGLDFEVTRDVLTPRPETELVVQAALDIWPTARRHTATGQIVVVDIGTGSGCIVVTLATELANARFIASDASLPALTVARRNAARHGVADRIAFLHTSMVPPEDDVDMIVCNPPYIPLDQRASLPPEVREYEPGIALFGGWDGLDVFRRLFDNVGRLTEGGWLIVEVGYDQADDVRALANPRFWAAGNSYRDLQGMERVLTFRALSTADEVDEAEDEDE
jgi:release factor glutamine methyltransferase